MNVTAVLLVTVVVWVISLIRSVRMRAFVYSLPLPISLALLTTGFRVDGSQVLGVIGLNLFFLVVSVLYHRLRWHILVSDLAGIAVYVGLSSLLLLAVPVPFVPALIGTLVLWVVVMLLLRRRAGRPVAPSTDATRDALPAPAKLLVIFLGSILTVFCGQLLQGMVVTFPYSGVLVAIETRRNLPEFSRHFARNSLALVSFTAGYYVLQDRSELVAMAGAWAAFAVTALLLRLPGRWAARSTSGTTGAPDGPVDEPEPDGVRVDRRASQSTTQRISEPRSTTDVITGAGSRPMPISFPPSPMPIRNARPDV
ncbi:hypothetical protein GCM10027290_49050 [Micromonospora sonneratiae]